MWVVLKQNKPDYMTEVTKYGLFQKHKVSPKIAHISVGVSPAIHATRPLGRKLDNYMSTIVNHVG